MRYFLGALLLALVLGGASSTSSAATVPCEVYPIPEAYHSGSGYTALACAPDGRVYVGTASYGGSAHLVRFDPRNKKWEKIFDAHSITREPITALDAQGKIHAKLLITRDGTVWAASKHGNEAFYERPEYGEDELGYPGGHLFSYSPRTHQVVDHGILKRHNGLMGGVLDESRQRLYYVSDPTGHLLIYDLARNTVRDLGYTGSIPRYMTMDGKGRVFLDGGQPQNPIGWPATGARTPFLCMYDPATDRMHQLAVQVEGPGQDAYMAPYVLIADAEGQQLFGTAIFGKHLMEFDLNSIRLDAAQPLANGTIICRHVAAVDPPLNQRAGVIGRDGKFYFPNSKFLMRYDAKARKLENLGEIGTEFGPEIYPQGAAVAPDGTLYFKYLFPYRLLRFPRLTAPQGAR